MAQALTRVPAPDLIRGGDPANGTTIAGFSRANAGVCGLGGSGPLYGHGYSTIGFLLDARRAANHPVAVATGSCEPARGHSRAYFGHGNKSRFLRRRTSQPVPD